MLASCRAWIPSYVRNLLFKVRGVFLTCANQTVHLTDDFNAEVSPQSLQVVALLPL